MKRSIILLLILLACPGISEALFYGKTCLTGGGACLDGMDGAGLADGDAAWVVLGTDQTCVYKLNATSGATETYESPCPYVITPNTNPGTKRWVFTRLSGRQAPVGTDPDVATLGDTGRDTNDHALRGWDGTHQYVYGQRAKSFTATVPKPHDQAEIDNLILWVNRTGFTLVIESIYSYSDQDNVNFTLKEMTNLHDFTAATTIESILISSDGVGVYYNELTSGIDHATIETGHAIAFDNDATDDPDSVTIVFTGYLDGDVP